MASELSGGPSGSAAIVVPASRSHRVDHQPFGALAEDWYVDAASGISLYEIERQFEGGSYKMLHLVLDLKRQQPPRGQRAPFERTSPEARIAYDLVARNIFQEPETVVTNELLEVNALQASLDRIRARRKLYYPDEQEDVSEEEPLQ